MAGSLEIATPITRPEIHFMKKIAALFLFAALSLHARADLIITEHLEDPYQAHELTMKVKGDKVRMDIQAAGNQFSTIIDLTTGDAIQLLHSQQKYIRVSGKKSKELIDALKKSKGLDPSATPPAQPEIVDTGKKEKVGNYNTEIFTTQSQGMKITLWVTKDIPDYASLLEQFKKLQSLQEKTGQQGLDTTKLDGIPVKREVVTAEGKTITMTMTSIKSQPLDDSEFALPAGYSEMQMPQAPAQ